MNNEPEGHPHVEAALVEVAVAIASLAAVVTTLSQNQVIRLAGISVFFVAGLAAALLATSYTREKTRPWRRLPFWIDASYTLLLVSIWLLFLGGILFFYLTFPDWAISFSLALMVVVLLMALIYQKRQRG
jgi:hypothetical protein